MVHKQHNIYRHWLNKWFTEWSITFSMVHWEIHYRPWLKPIISNTIQLWCGLRNGNGNLAHRWFKFCWQQGTVWAWKPATVGWRKQPAAGTFQNVKNLRVNFYLWRTEEKIYWFKQLPYVTVAEQVVDCWNNMIQLSYQETLTFKEREHLSQTWITWFSYKTMTLWFLPEWGFVRRRRVVAGVILICYHVYMCQIRTTIVTHTRWKIHSATSQNVPT